MKCIRLYLAGLAFLAVMAGTAGMATTAKAETSVLLGTTQTSWPGGTTTGYETSNTIAAYKWTATATASTATANMYFTAHGATELVGVYTDDAANGTPGTLLGSVSMGSSGTGWKVVTFTGVSITAGTNYWLAELQASSGTNSFPINAHISGTGACTDPHPTNAFLDGYSSFPSSWNTSGSYNPETCPHGLVVKG